MGADVTGITFEASHGTQIVVLLVPTTRPEDIAAYANRVFNTWKPGRQGVGEAEGVAVSVVSAKTGRDDALDAKTRNAIHAFSRMVSFFWIGMRLSYS